MSNVTYLHPLNDESTAPSRLGKQLLAHGLITQDQLHIALHEQKKSGEMIGLILVRLGILPAEKLAQLLAFRTDLDAIDLAQVNIDMPLLDHFPRTEAERHHVLPLYWEKEALVIAVADPYDLSAIDTIRRHFSHEIVLKPHVASLADIKRTIDEGYGFASSLESIIGEIGPHAVTVKNTEHPIVRLVDTILTDAVRRNASDIHFEPEDNSVRLRYRIDGVLEQIREIHISYWPAIAQRLKLIAGLNIADQRSIQDGRFTQACDSNTIDFRVAVMPTVWGENIVVRVLDPRRALLSLPELGFSSDAIETLVQIMERPEGIILVTGPTGSGKSTTLYALLRQLSNQETSINSLEEPVEYQMNLVRQTTINEAQGLNFGTGVRGVLRQDPDIIFIGEIRDADTAQMALRSAMTGHQVYSTLHCNDVWGALPRLIDLGASPRLLAGHISGIIAQRLVRKLCAHCKITMPANEDERRIMRCTAAQQVDISIPVGCPHCNNTGRRGRTAIAEILRVTPEIDDMMLSETGRLALRQQADGDGFRSLQQNGIAKVMAGEIALDDLRRAVDMTRGL